MQFRSLWAGVLTAMFVFLSTSCERDPTAASLVRSLAISPFGEFLDVGQSTELSATTADGSGSVLGGVEVSWSSSNPAIVEVAGRTATGRAPGSAYVRATAGRLSDSVLMRVEVPVARLVVWPADTVRLIRGRLLPVLVEMFDAQGAAMTHSLAVESSDPRVVAIRDGIPQGVATGRAILTFRAGSRRVPMEIEVVTGARFTARRVEPLEPAALNNLGWVVGSANGQAALWRNGEVTALTPGRYSVSSARAVNDSGVVAGIGRKGAAAAPELWIWRGGQVREIPLGMQSVPGRASAEVVIRSMNLRGELVGRVTMSDTAASYSFHWDRRDLRVLPRGYHATDINDRGTILLTQGIVEGGVKRELPRPPFAPGLWSAISLNDKGQYGGFFSGGCYSGYFWDGSTYQDVTPRIGCSFLLAVNNYEDLLGNYIGMASSFGGTQLIRDGVAINLYMAVPAPQVLTSQGLNDVGQVIVTDRRTHYATDASGKVILTDWQTQVVGYLLSPAS